MSSHPRLDRVLDRVLALAIGDVDRPFGHSTPGGAGGMVRAYRRMEHGREEEVSGYQGRMRHESAAGFAHVIANSRHGRLGQAGDFVDIMREAHEAHGNPEKMRAFLQKHNLPVPHMDDNWKELHGMPKGGGGSTEPEARAAEVGRGLPRTEPESRLWTGLQHPPGAEPPATHGVIGGTKNAGRGAARPYGKPAVDQPFGHGGRPRGKPAVDQPFGHSTRPRRA